MISSQWVELPVSGWVDFGEGELPLGLGLRQIDAMPAAYVMGDGHSAAGLVAPHVVERFLADTAFADAVLRLFGKGPEVIRSIFSTRRGWDRVDDLTASVSQHLPPIAGRRLAYQEYLDLRMGRGLSRNDAATLAAELLPNDRDRRYRLRKVTGENVRGVEEGRDSPHRYLRSRLDRVYRADGRTGNEAVHPEKLGDTFVFRFPKFWVGPVWFAIKATDDQPAVVRIDWHDNHKEFRIAGGVVVTCRQPGSDWYPFRLTCPPGWSITGGMGWVDGAEDINLGWHRETDPELEGTINQNLLEAFEVTTADWDNLLHRHGIDPSDPL